MSQVSYRPEGDNALAGVKCDGVLREKNESGWRRRESVERKTWRALDTGQHF